jgi:fumarylacetoacetate (FAA) hydrolase
MKLATLLDRTRDGALVVVSRDLTHYVSARPIAPTLQAALDDWAYAGPRLADLAHDLEIRAVPAIRFHETEAMAPLPRAFLRLDAAGAPSVPPRLERSDRIAAPRAATPLAVAVPAEGVTAACGLVAVLDDIAAGASPAQARAAIRLLGLAVDLRRGATATDMLATAFSPVLATPDECGAAFDGSRLGLPVTLSIDDAEATRFDLGLSLAEGIDAVAAAAAARHPLGAGTLVTALPLTTGALTAGRRLRLDARVGAGHALFGAIALTVAGPA